MKFQQVYVRVWVPKEYRLVGDPEGYTNHISVGLWDSRKITRAVDNPDGWFPQDTSSFDFQVGGTTYLFSNLTGPTELKIDYWHIPSMTLVASLIVLVIGVVLVPFSLDAKVFTILTGVLVVSFAGLFTPSIVNSWLLAARLGFAGVVALWLVVWLLFLRRTGHFQAVPARPTSAGSGAAGVASKGATESPPTPGTPFASRKSADSEAHARRPPLRRQLSARNCGRMLRERTSRGTQRANQGGAVMTSDETLQGVLSARCRVLGCLWLASCALSLPPSPAAAQVTGGPPRIRNVYIPSDQLKVLFGSSSKGVLMPREKILALWHDARSRDRSEVVPPADAVLTQATYEARLDEHELQVSGRIQIAKLQGDWQTVDLPFGGLAIESAQLDGQPARFGRQDDGTLFLLLREAGRGELALEMSAPLASKGGDLATTLRLPPVPASEVLIRLDESKQLQVGETILPPAGADGDQQVFRIAVDQTGLVPLLVSDRFAGGNRSPLVFVRSRSEGHIEPAGLRWQVDLDLDVYARATDSFQLQLPNSVDVAEVEAPQLAQWTIEDRADDTAVLRLNFRKPFVGRRGLRLLGLAPAPLAKEWDVPTVKVLQAASHVGEILVHSSPSLRVETGGLAGIRPARLSRSEDDFVETDLESQSKPDDRAGSPRVASNTALTFAFWDEDFRLPLRVVQRHRTLQVSVATLVEVGRASVELRSSVTVQPRYAPVFGIQLQLPRDWEVTSVLSGGEAVEWELIQRAPAAPVATGAADAVLQTVQFDLAKPLPPGRSLEIALTAEQYPDSWLAEDDRFSELPLPALRLVGADEVEGTVLIRTPPDMDLLVSDLSDDLQPVAARRSESTSAQTSGTALQYRYQDDAVVSGRLQVRTKPAKVSAQTLAFVRLDHGKLDVHYQLDLYIGQGKIRQVRFSLPAAVGNRIQVAPVNSPARVIEQEHTPLPDAGGTGADLYSWRIVLDRHVTGNLTLAVDFEQEFSTRAADDEIAESATEQADTPVAIPVLALRNVSRQSGIVALEAASDQQIDYEPENLRDLDPADVSQPRVYVPSQRIVAAYHYPRLPYRLAISATRHASESVLTALCESAEITSVPGRQGRMRHQARFWLRSGNLQHLPVKLPVNADLWSVILDGQPVEVREKQGAYIVPLPARQAHASNDARDLTLVYETDSPRLTSEGLWERLRPRTIRQSPPEIAITTLGTTWYVHPPEGNGVGFEQRRLEAGRTAHSPNPSQSLGGIDCVPEHEPTAMEVRRARCRRRPGGYHRVTRQGQEGFVHRC